MKKILSLMALSVFFITSFSQNTININNKTYVKNGDKWYISKNGTDTTFLVDEKSISVKFKKDVGSIDNGLDSLALSGIILKEIRRNKLGYLDFEVPIGTNIFELFSKLSHISIIDHVEINSFGKYCYTANDTYLNQQWYIDKIKANLGWDYTGGNKSIVIAILDCGSDWTHEDIGLGSDNYQNIWLNPGEDAWTSSNDPSTGDLVDNDGNGFIDDWKGWDFDQNDNDSRGTLAHGTNVAGIAAAKTNNNRGISGVAGGLGAEGVKLMILNVGHTNPIGAVLDDAINYAANNGANVIQMSLEVSSSQAIIDAIEDAYDNHGITLVCAAGNQNGAVTFPASNSQVIAVGSTSSNDTKSSFSNYGSDLEISAPGESIYTTILNNGYTNSNMNGTSFSAPQISATVGLLLSIDPSISPDSVRAILRSSADKVGGYNYNWSQNTPGQSVELGYGRLNVENAIKEIYPSISGPSLVCYSTETPFTVDGLPSGATITWQYETSLLEPVSDQGSNPCYFIAIGSGNAWVQAVINTTYGQYPLPQVNCSAGSPTILYLDGPTYVQTYSNNYYCAEKDVWNLNAQYYWYLSQDGIYTSPTNQNRTYITFETPDHNTVLEVAACNSCGCSDNYYLEIDVNGYYRLMLSPNPSTAETTVSIGSTSGESIDANVEWNFEVYDQGFQLKARQTKIIGKEFKLNTSGWREGVYIVRANYKGKFLTEKLVVKR